MAKISLVLLAAVLLHLATVHCLTEGSSGEPDGHLLRRRRRQQDATVINSDTASMVLSILPLDRIGTIVGQVMGTGLKEMLNPDVGKKLVNVIENQAPLLLTSLFTNLYSTLRVPVRSTSSNATISLNSNAVKQLSNTSTSEIINAIRRPGTK